MPKFLLIDVKPKFTNSDSAILTTMYSVMNLKDGCISEYTYSQLYNAIKGGGMKIKLSTNFNRGNLHYEYASCSFSVFNFGKDSYIIRAMFNGIRKGDSVIKLEIYKIGTGELVFSHETSGESKYEYLERIKYSFGCSLFLDINTCIVDKKVLKVELRERFIHSFHNLEHSLRKDLSFNYSFGVFFIKDKSHFVEESIRLV